MRTQERPSRKSRKLSEQQQKVDLAKSMGVQFDPMAQMSQLVQLMNMLQGPEQQQQQHADELELRRLLGMGEQTSRDEALRQQGLQNLWTQEHGTAELGLQREGLTANTENAKRTLKQRDLQFDAEQKQRLQMALYTMLQSLMSAGTGGPNPKFGIEQDPANALSKRLDLGRLFGEPGKTNITMPPSQAFAEVANRMPK